MFALDQN